MHTHCKILQTANFIADAPTKHQKQYPAKESGIKGFPSLQQVGSLDYARSLPWDWIHIFLENVIPTLVSHWSDSFKNLNSGVEDYIIPCTTWEEISEETAHAIKDIPSSFVCVIRNIAKDHSNFTTESCDFWFMHIEPFVLHRCFLNEKYYVHMCRLVDLMKVMIKFELTYMEINDIE
jgi:hypothetical protein